MWPFIIFTQLLVVITSVMLWWFIKPKHTFGKITLVVAVCIVNNLVLIYGLTESLYERFHVYLVVGTLQGFMLYTALIVAIIWLIYHQLFKYPFSHKYLRVVAVVIYIGIVSLAVFNAYSPVVHHITVTTNKPLDKPMTIALASDTHLGRWFGNRQLNKFASLIALQHPDVVMLAGDIMNDATYYYDKNNMHEQLSKLHAPLGVYAVLGNHDYSGNQVEIANVVADAGINVIDNKSVLLDDSVWLVGRSDETDPMRPKAAKLLTQVDTNKPVIFLEHSPAAMNEISALPVDLHLSGHTHGGQIFPMTILIHWLQPLVYGAKQLGGTDFLVTSGYGFGAVPFRLGTRSEIWIIKLQSTS